MAGKEWPSADLGQPADVQEVRSDGDCDEVDPADSELACELAHLPGLGWCEGLNGVDSAAAPGLDLDGHTAAVRDRNDVDFATADAMIAVGNGQSAVAQESSGDRLPEASEAEPVV